MTGRSKMRVAQIIGRMDAAGVESVVFNYFRYVNKQNIGFDIYYNADSSVGPPEEIVREGAEFYPIRPYRRPLGYLTDLWRALDKRKYDVVHAHVNTLSVIPLCVARLKGIPVRIAHSHSTMAPGEGMRNVAKYLFRPLSRVFPTHLMACSISAGTWLFGKKAMRDGRVTVLRNAIPLEHFAFDPALRAQTREALGVGDAFVVGHVGRFVFQKNHAFLLDVFAELKKREPNARLLLVGDGPLRESMSAQAEALGILDDVIFAGVTRRVSAYYQAMDCFVFPSRYEGLGLTVVEAQAAGLPVLASLRVPEEALFTPCGERLPLNLNAAQWAKTVVEGRRRWQRREDGRRLAEEAGFSIKGEAGKLEAFYMACTGEKVRNG